MQDIHLLSRIGFGCYRVSAKSPEHRAALKAALSSGCNLIDTSANYMGGQSEELVGLLLREIPDGTAFVVTKAGYVSPPDHAFLRDHPHILSNCAQLADGTLHCLDPDFLRFQLEQSLQRLGRNWIDGFLLHNPDYHLDMGVAAYQRIGRAFAMLEELARNGTIRFYGISSPSLGQPASPLTLDLGRLLELSKHVASKNGFKLAQFPCNLAELSPTADHDGRGSLLQRLKQAELIGISNRPLNARSGGKRLRLAYRDDDGPMPDDQDIAESFTRIFALVDKQLAALDIDGSAEEITALSDLKVHWAAIDSTDAVAEIFQSIIYPTLAQLYPDGIYPDVLSAIRILEILATRAARARMNEAAQTFHRKLIRDGILPENDGRPLPLVACEKLLNIGVDHVLVGMRSPAYVSALSPLF